MNEWKLPQAKFLKDDLYHHFKEFENLMSYTKEMYDYSNHGILEEKIRLKDFVDILDDKNNVHSDEESDILRMIYGSKISEIEEYVRNSLISNTFVPAYGLVELTALNFCRSFIKYSKTLGEKLNYSPVTLNDLRGRGLEKSKRYYSKILNINDIEFYIHEYKLFNKIRNSIVHSSGLVELDQKDDIIKTTTELLKKDKSKYFDITRIEFTNYGPYLFQIKLSDLFYQGAVKKFSEFISKLHRVLEEHIDEKVESSSEAS